MLFLISYFRTSVSFSRIIFLQYLRSSFENTPFTYFFFLPCLLQDESRVSPEVSMAHTVVNKHNREQRHKMCVACRRYGHVLQSHRQSSLVPVHTQDDAKWHQSKKRSRLKKSLECFTSWMPLVRDSSFPGAVARGLVLMNGSDWRHLSPAPGWWSCPSAAEPSIVTYTRNKHPEGPFK